MADQAGLEPHALLRAVRDDDGRIIDFRYLEINEIASRQQRRRPGDLLHRSVVDTLPAVKSSGLLAEYARCVDTGRPLVLNDFAYYGKALPGAAPRSATPQSRRYDVRGIRVADDCISVRWRDVTDRVEALAAAEQDRDLLRISTDALFDPQVLLEVAYGESGEPVDLVLRDANLAFCDYLRKQRADLVGLLLTELFPRVTGTALLAQYLDSAMTGKPVLVDDFPYFNEVLGEYRRYDVRGRRVRPGLVVFTFRDVTKRFETERQLAASEEHYRLLAENSSDVVVRFRDGIIVWISPSVERALGLPPAAWVGRRISTLVPAEDHSILAEVLDFTATGESVVRRVRVYGADGDAHWVSVHVKAFYNGDGTPDGRIASFRVIDDEVNAEHAAEQDRRQKQEADARYRRLIETSSVATALVSLDGRFEVVNPAMCEFFGYDSATLLTMNWKEMTEPEDVGAGVGGTADLIARRSESFRITKRYIHRDGRRIWGALSVTAVRSAAGEAERLISQVIDVTAEVEARQRLRAVTDAMIDPQTLIAPVRDSSGQIVDFVYREVNAAVCEYLGMSREELLGGSLLATLPRLDGCGLLAHYAHAVDTGEPVILDDYPCFDEILNDLRRYDIRAMRAGPDLLSLTWRDVTERAEQREATREALELLRSATDAMLDPQALVEAVRNAAGEVVDLVYRDVNRAFSEYVGISREQQVGHSVSDSVRGVDGAAVLARYAHCAVTGEPIVLDDFPYLDERLDRPRRYDIRGTQVRPGLITLTFRDTTERFEAQQAVLRSEERYRLLALNSTDAVLHLRDRRVIWASPAIESVLGAPPEYWIGREMIDAAPAEDIPAFVRMRAILEAGGAIQERIRLNSVDGVTHWLHVHATPFYDAQGRPDGVSAALRLIDDEVAAERELDDARRRQAAADALHRRSMESAAVGMCLASPDGPFLEVNQALCEFFGYDAEILLSKTWVELTAPEYRDADLANVADLVAGRIESYQMEKQFIRADGRRRWGHLAVGCLREDDGSVTVLVGQVVDITDRVEAERRLTVELDSAAGYLRSILPRDASGPVAVSAYYLPSRQLGGDCFDHRWIDEDHLMVYLLDVSGHGLKPALLAVSVHNMLRSGALPDTMLLAPEQVLTELNARFQMDANDGHYLTMWFGVYQRSTRTMTYASAGHPPALVLSGGRPAELLTPSRPVGVFADTVFRTTTYTVPPGSRILIYSDGAFEFRLGTGGRLGLEEFADLCVELAATPQFSAASLVDRLRQLSATEAFADDCSVLLMHFGDDA